MNIRPTPREERARSPLAQEQDLAAEAASAGYSKQWRSPRFAEARPASIADLEGNAQLCASRHASSLLPARGPSVHLDRPAVEFHTIERGDCQLRLLCGGELHHAHAPGQAAALAPALVPALAAVLHQDLRVVHGARLRHEVLQGLPPRLEVQVADEDLARVVRLRASLPVGARAVRLALAAGHGLPVRHGYTEKRRTAGLGTLQNRA
mmetsp:Transcript_53774/g.136546  ORF Transcript_53774/g.136546 Transcript_53774/m.136546 type:complete len:208 (-) Transcript_53774:8-631(-)